MEPQQQVLVVQFKSCANYDPTCQQSIFFLVFAWHLDLRWDLKFYMNLIQSYNTCINASINSDTSELIETGIQRSYDCIKVINILRSQRASCIRIGCGWLLFFLLARTVIVFPSQQISTNFSIFYFNTKSFKTMLMTI